LQQTTGGDGGLVVDEVVQGSPTERKVGESRGRQCVTVDSHAPGLKLCICMRCQGEIKPEFQLISVDETDVRVRRCPLLLCLC